MKNRERLSSVPAQKATTPAFPRTEAAPRTPAAPIHSASALRRAEALGAAAASPYPGFLRGLENAPDPRALNRLRQGEGLQAGTDMGAATPSPPRSPVVQRVIQVAPTDVDPVLGPKTSTFNGPRFGLVWAALAGTNFRNTLNGYPAARAHFTFAFLNPLLAAQPDIPNLATAIINAVSNGVYGAQAALTPHVADLELALGTHAHTDAGVGDIANFRVLSGAGGVTLSRSKGVPSSLSQASLNGASGPTDTALNLLIGQITARNNQLDDVNYYFAGAGSRSRGNFGVAGIRGGHENGAGWLAPSVAAPPDAALLAAVNPAGVLLQGEAKPRRIAIGNALVGAAAAAAQASDVEDTVDASGDVGLQNYFYRSVFWPNVPAKADRVQLAWARYGSDSSNVANCGYIEFGGGGVASRIIWDYVNDQFFLSAHYNWVDGYNPFFEITGTAATY